MVQFRVRAQSLGEVAAQLNSVVAVFDGHVASVTGVVRSTVNASWVGEDADKFEEVWTSWNEQSVLVRSALTNLAALLVAAEGTYTATESGQQSGFIQRRQANVAVVDQVEMVSQSVEIGQERVEDGGEPFLTAATGSASLVSRGASAQQGGGRSGARVVQAGFQTEGGAAAARVKPEGNTDV